MSKRFEASWADRKSAWLRFARWTPPDSERERSTRLRWLDDALRLAREQGALPDEPIDSPSIRARRQRVRRALATIRG